MTNDEQIRIYLAGAKSVRRGIRRQVGDLRFFPILPTKRRFDGVLSRRCSAAQPAYIDALACQVGDLTNTGIRSHHDGDQLGVEGQDRTQFIERFAGIRALTIVGGMSDIGLDDAKLKVSVTNSV